MPLPASPYEAAITLRGRNHPTRPQYAELLSRSDPSQPTCISDVPAGGPSDARRIVRLHSQPDGFQGKGRVGTGKPCQFRSRSNICHRGSILMASSVPKVLVFQHLAIEHPGVFRDFLHEDGIEWTAVELDSGRTRRVRAHSGRRVRAHSGPGQLRRALGDGRAHGCLGRRCLSVAGAGTRSNP